MPGQVAASKDDEIRPPEVSSRKEEFHEPLLRSVALDSLSFVVTIGPEHKAPGR